MLGMISKIMTNIGMIIDFKEGEVKIWDFGIKRLMDL